MEKLLEQSYVAPRLKSSLQKFYGRHHELIGHYKISISQMTMDLFPFTYNKFVSSIDYCCQDFYWTGLYIWVTQRVSYNKQKLLTLLWTPEFNWVIWWGTCCSHFSFLCCVFFTLFVFILCPMLPVSLDCPFLIHGEKTTHYTTDTATRNVSIFWTEKCYMIFRHTFHCKIKHALTDNLYYKLVKIRYFWWPGN